MSQSDAVNMVMERLDRVVDSYRINQNEVEVAGFRGGDAIIYRVRRTCDGYLITEK